MMNIGKGGEFIKGEAGRIHGVYFEQRGRFLMDILFCLFFFRKELLDSSR